MARWAARRLAQPLAAVPQPDLLPGRLAGRFPSQAPGTLQSSEQLGEPWVVEEDPRERGSDLYGCIEKKVVHRRSRTTAESAFPNGLGRWLTNFPFRRTRIELTTAQEFAMAESWRQAASAADRACGGKVAFAVSAGDGSVSPLGETERSRHADAAGRASDQDCLADPLPPFVAVHAVSLRAVRQAR